MTHTVYNYHNLKPYDKIKKARDKCNKETDIFCKKLCYTLCCCWCNDISTASE